MAQEEEMSRLKNKTSIKSNHVQKQSSCECIIHCTDDDTELVRAKDEESWSTLVRAAAVRKHKPVLDIAETLNEGEIPSIYYHRECCSVFTIKKALRNNFKAARN